MSKQWNRTRINLVVMYEPGEFGGQFPALANCHQVEHDLTGSPQRVY